MKTEENTVENVIVDTRRKIRYVILASRKLTREEMLRIIRLYNYNPMNLKVTHGDEIIIQSDL